MDEKKSDFVVEPPVQGLGGAFEFGGDAPAVLTGVDQTLSALDTDGDITQMTRVLGDGVRSMSGKRQDIGGLVALTPLPVELLDFVVVGQQQ